MTGLALVLGLGSRAWTDRALINAICLDTWHDATQLGYQAIEVMEGTADGADTMFGDWAKAHRADGIAHKSMAADWEAPCPPECKPGHRRTRRDGTTYCPTAGHRRNQHMVDQQPLLALACQVGNSTGTADCLRRVKAACIPVRRFELPATTRLQVSAQEGRS